MCKVARGLLTGGAGGRESQSVSLKEINKLSQYRIQTHPCRQIEREREREREREIHFTGDRASRFLNHFYL